MSHLQHIMNFREHLTSLGVTCAVQINDAVQEGYVRAVLRNHLKFSDGLSFTEEEENSLWNQLDKWNSVSPVKARFVIESAKVRLLKVRKCLLEHGTLPGNEEYNVYVDHATVVDDVPTTAKIDATANESFAELVEFLYTEMRAGHE